MLTSIKKILFTIIYSISLSLLLPFCFDYSRSFALHLFLIIRKWNWLQQWQCVRFVYCNFFSLFFCVISNLLSQDSMKFGISCVRCIYSDCAQCRHTLKNTSDDADTNEINSKCVFTVECDELISILQN